MLSRSYIHRQRSSLFVFLSCASAILGFFSLASPAHAVICHCVCGVPSGRAVHGPSDQGITDCSLCPATCREYCNADGEVVVTTACVLPDSTPSTVRPSSGSSGGTSGRRRTTTGGSTTPGGAGTSAGTTGGAGAGTTGTPGPTGGSDTSGSSPTGASGSTGVCSFNCMTPRLTACTTNEDCRTLCTTQCPTLVGGNATCATNPAPRCITAVDGTKNCAFECVVTPQESCQIGDAGNIQCGTRGMAVCAPPAGAGRTAPTINVSTVVQPRCIAPPGSSDAPAGESGEVTGETGGSGSRSESSGSGTSASYRLRNPIQGATTIPQIIGKAVRAVMGLVGAIALLMFVLGGVRWILAAGDSKEVQAASELLKNASIGLLIIFLSYTVITVGMGLVNDLSGQGSSSGTTQSSS